MINCCLTPLKMQRKIGDTEESFWEWKSWQRASANEGVGKISPQNIFYRSIYFTHKQMERSTRHFLNLSLCGQMLAKR